MKNSSRKPKKRIKNRAKMTKLFCEAYNKALVTTAGGALVEEYNEPKTNSNGK